MRSFRVQVLWCVAALVALVLVGCQPTAGGPAAPVDAERAQSLNIAIPGRIADPTNLNLYAPGVSRSNTGLHQVIYEYFFYQNLQTGEYIPWLAESYEYNDDFTAITVHLRDGVRWSDGEPFTSADVLFTYDLLMNNPAMTWAAEVIKNVASIGSRRRTDSDIQPNIDQSSLPPKSRGIPSCRNLGRHHHLAPTYLGE